ncbi:MAG TPA: hypothetical protein VGN90_10140 [Pyrinomonadaceae bacterium]|jgi:hypothetical protein|nr:hypothetical protein [Pyrinomonadaceae bacterium]
MAQDKAVVSKICRKTRRVLIGAVDVNEGQHLHYFITVVGSKPLFSLVCEHKKVHFDAVSLGKARQNYEVEWQRDSADAPGQDGDTYTFGMSFGGADQYTLRVELHDANHELVDDGVIVDADYFGNPVTFLCNESFVIRT